MKDNQLWRAVERLATGRGFYIVLALCITAVGMAGYYLLDSVTAPLNIPEPVPEIKLRKNFFKKAKIILDIVEQMFYNRGQKKRNA